MFIFNITGIQSVFTERSNCKTLSQFFFTVFTDWDNVTLIHLLLLLESLLSVMSSFVFPFLAHLAKGHVSFCHHLASVVRLYVVNFNLLPRNHWANCSQTLVEWYLYGPLPNLCPSKWAQILTAATWQGVV